MLNKITNDLNNVIKNFPLEDKILFKNKIIELNNTFSPLLETNTEKITYIDGGQAEIISTANFNLSLIKVAAVTFNNKQKLSQEIKHFFVLTTTFSENDCSYYQAKIYAQNPLINDFKVNKKDDICKVVEIARKKAELELAKQFTNSVLLDGVLEEGLPENVSALAKSSSLTTLSGNSPNILLTKLTNLETWFYHLIDKTYFVKLHPKSKHIFRFEGDTNILKSLNSSDPIFIGYPYGLILADKLARVSNEEKNSLNLKIILDKKNEEIIKYLQTQNAHSILDNTSY
jgi:hypothetical protein